jgi:hypothetical protein
VGNFKKIARNGPKVNYPVLGKVKVVAGAVERVSLVYE